MNSLRYSHIKIDEDKTVRVPVKKELAHYELTLDNNTVEYDLGQENNDYEQ